MALRIASTFTFRMVALYCKRGKEIRGKQKKYDITENILVIFLRCFYYKTEKKEKKKLYIYVDKVDSVNCRTLCINGDSCDAFI